MLLYSETWCRSAALAGRRSLTGRENSTPDSITGLRWQWSIKMKKLCINSVQFTGPLTAWSLGFIPPQDHHVCLEQLDTGCYTDSNGSAMWFKNNITASSSVKGTNRRSRREMYRFFFFLVDGSKINSDDSVPLLDSVLKSSTFSLPVFASHLLLAALLPPPSISPPIPLSCTPSFSLSLSMVLLILIRFQPPSLSYRYLISSLCLIPLSLSLSPSLIPSHFSNPLTCYPVTLTSIELFCCWLFF